MIVRLPRDPIDILLVEDNPGDVGLVREGLRTGSLAHALHVVTSGQQALDFLHRRNGHAGSPRPDFVILDLNLPGHSGHVVLQEVKTDPDLRPIPVCILTSSHDPADVEAAYAAHANAYVAKPIELDAFLDAVHDIEEFWFSTAALPDGARE